MSVTPLAAGKESERLRPQLNNPVQEPREAAGEWQQELEMDRGPREIRALGRLGAAHAEIGPLDWPQRAPGLKREGPEEGALSPFGRQGN